MSQYIGFNLGKEEYVLPILMVQEIMKPVEATQLPYTQDYMIGVINLRGKNIPVIDLKMKLGIKSNGVGADEKIIVINIGKMTFGNRVDSITGVLNIDEEMIKKSLDLVEGETGEYIEGVANIGDNRMVLIMDFSKLLNIDDMSLLEHEIIESETTKDGKVMLTKKKTGMGGDYLVREVREAFEKNVKEKGLEKDTINEIMEQVQILLDSFTAGDIAGAEKAIEVLSSYGEREIYSEIGKITRRLHDSLKDFKTLIDPRLKNMAQDEMPEAADKLQWVISKTDDAANKTINISEKNLSLISDISKRIDDIEKRLNDSDSKFEKEKESITFIKNGLNEINNDFMEIVLAQEFQDLTGQIIKKVITLVSDLEKQLVTLVKVFGVKVETKEIKKDLSGPQIKEDEGILSNQGDVDDLLSELGF